MKRLLIFGLFGSAVWAVSASLVVDLIFGGFTLPSPEGLALIATDIPVWFPVALTFAAVIGMLDFGLEKARLSTPYRACICGAIGLSAVNWMFVPSDPALLTFLSISLAGAVPGALCSWLSGRPAAGAVTLPAFEKPIAP
jgi:hypothetical protein